MRYLLLRCTALVILILSVSPDVTAQKRGKRRAAASQKKEQALRADSRPAPVVDMGRPEPRVPIPQEQSLRPELKKTKKVVIVPAPPPPPGRDPIPPYPKR